MNQVFNNVGTETDLNWVQCWKAAATVSKCRAQMKLTLIILEWLTLALSLCHILIFLWCCTCLLGCHPQNHGSTHAMFRDVLIA